MKSPFCGFVPGGYNASSESQESKAPSNKDPSTWSVEDVVWFIRDADPQALGPHADIFRKHVSLFIFVFLTGCFASHPVEITNFFFDADFFFCFSQEIDGNALLLLKSDMIMKYLGLKLGPALKLCYHIDKLKQTKFWKPFMMYSSLESSGSFETSKSVTQWEERKVRWGESLPLGCYNRMKANRQL